MDGVCQSYAPAKTLMQGNHARVMKQRGKYKQAPCEILK